MMSPTASCRMHFTILLTVLLINEQFSFNYACSEHALKTALFADYDKEVRPVKEQSTKLNIRVVTEIYSILSLDEQSELIDLILWTSLTWTDEFLKWNISESNNCTFIRTLSSNVWQPDVVYLNVVESTSIVSDDTNYISIDHEGSITAWRATHSKLRCDMDISKFPFDTQACLINLGLWTYEANTTILSFGDKRPTPVHKGASEFETVSYVGESVTSQNKITNESYTELHYILTLKRRPEYYVYVLLVPSFLLTSLCIIGIFTPHCHEGERHEKMSLGLTTLMTMGVLLNITADAVPKSSTGLPLLGYYILCEIIVCSISTAISTMIIFFHERAHTLDWDPPRIIRWIATRTFDTSFGWSQKVRSSPDERVSTISELYSNDGKVNQRKIRNETIGEDFDQFKCDKTTEMQELFANLQKMISTTAEHLDHKKKFEKKSSIWVKAFDRIDFFFLIVLLILNAVVTFMMLF